MFYHRNGDPITGVDDDDVRQQAAAYWATDEARRVAEDYIGKLHISTVFLVIDHRHDRGGPPLLFETMVFAGEDGDVDCRRYCTEAEALAGHEQIVQDIRRNNFVGYDEPIDTLYVIDELIL